MIVLSALRDFADGLARGFSLFLTERHDSTVRGIAPAVPRQPRHR